MEAETIAGSLSAVLRQDVPQLHIPIYAAILTQVGTGPVLHPEAGKAGLGMLVQGVGKGLEGQRDFSGTDMSSPIMVAGALQASGGFTQVPLLRIEPQPPPNWGRMTQTSWPAYSSPDEDWAVSVQNLDDCGPDSRGAACVPHQLCQLKKGTPLWQDDDA